MSATAHAAPDRSLQQRLAALRNANEVRARRAELKRDIHAGRRDALAVLLDPPEWASTMLAWDVITATHKFGPVRAARAFDRCRISPRKTIAGMTERQRRALVEWLRTRP